MKTLTFCLFYVLAVSLATTAPEPLKRPGVRITGVKILVSDMNEAIEFYTNTIGYRIRSRAHYPEMVSLQSGDLELQLVSTRRPAQAAYSGTVRTTFGFQANDLMATRARLLERGVEFIEDQPDSVGIGIATTFKDPFGSIRTFQRDCSWPRWTTRSSRQHL